MRAMILMLALTTSAAAAEKEAKDVAGEDFSYAGLMEMTVQDCVEDGVLDDEVTDG